MSIGLVRREKLRKLVAEIDERAGSALEILNDLSAEDLTMVEDETLLEGLDDLQVLLSDWQQARGLI